MIRTMQRKRWDAGRGSLRLVDPDFGPRPSAPRAIPIETDIVARLLAEDERLGRHECRLGMQLASGFVALLALGVGIPMLAFASLAAPFIGVGMEIFSRRA